MIPVAEQRVLQALEHDEEAHLCGRVGNEPCPHVQAVEGSTWAEERTLSASFIYLLISSWSERPHHHCGLRIHGARITGQLDLGWVTFNYPLTLRDCHLESVLTAESATIGVLDLGGSSLPGMLAPGLVTRTDLRLTQARIHGTVELAGARIGRNLDCDGADLHGLEDGDALTAEGADIGGGVLLRHGFTAHGTVMLYGAKIGSNLECEGADLIGPVAGDALTVEGADIGRSVLLRNGFTAEGEVKRFTAHGTVRLYGAKIGRHLDCGGADLIGPEEGNALTAEGADIGGAVLMRDGFTAHGTVRFFGAKIGSNLECEGADLTGPESGDALTADFADIGGAVFLRNGFTADGAVRRFTAHGAVMFSGAKIGSDLDCEGADLTGPKSGDALTADFVDIGGGVLLRNGFTAQSTVWLRGAKIGDDVDCKKGKFCAPGPDKHVLLLERCQIGGNVDLRFASPPEGIVGLADARAGTYVDSQESWPSKIQLEGFVYQRIQGEDRDGKQVTAADRKEWLAKEVTDEGKTTYSPRPYEQLASVYRAAGDDHEARRVAITNRQAHRHNLTKRPRHWPARAWSLFLGATVGHGYRPWQAAYWLVGAWIISGWVVSSAKSAGELTPASEGAPAINPWAYSLDVLVPIVDLGQGSAWQVTSGSARFWFWLAVLMGWALTTAVVAGVSSAVRRE